MTTQTPSGWYPDPYGSPQLRWWDGSQWTDATHAVDAPTGQAAPQGPQTGPVPFPQAPSPEAGAQQAGPHPGQWEQQTVQYQEPGAGQPQWGGPQGPGTGQSQWGGPGQGDGQSQWSGPGQGGATMQLPSPQFGGYPSGPPPRKSSPLPWILGGGGVLILIVVIVIGAMYLVDPGRRNSASERTGLPSPFPTLSREPAPEPTPEATPSQPSSGTPPQPQDGRITDPVTGLSFEIPGSPWRVPSKLGGGLGFTWTSGAVAVAQSDFDGQGNDWLGNVFTGQLPTQYGYSGPASMRSVAATLLQVVEPAFYTPPHKRKIVEDKAIKVSGKDAWLLVFDLDFTEQSEANGWKWKRERAAFVIVDRGAGATPALAYISVPDNLGLSVADQVVTSLKLS
ncbi:DUF2510 domain-containing protein [Streptosporangium fragile]